MQVLRTMHTLLLLFPVAVYVKERTNCQDREEKFKVIRVYANNTEQLAMIMNLYCNSTDQMLNFWKTPRKLGDFADIMIDPLVSDIWMNRFSDEKMTFAITVHDVEKLMIERERKYSEEFSVQNSSSIDYFKRFLDVQTAIHNKAKLKLSEYHSYDEITRWLSEIERHYPSIAKVFTIGVTHENRTIQGIKIGNPIENKNKRIIWIDGGIHAREWASIQTALYFIDQLISKYEHNQLITFYVNYLNFYIVPVVNPDGLEYSRSDSGPQVRFWRKNRGKQVCKRDRWRREQCCSGVDLNRNFDFHWGEAGSSNDICSDTFQGTSAFSEPETRAIRDKILSLELNGKVDAFITLHTYSQMWLHPYNHLKHSYPADIDDLKHIAIEAVKALRKVYGTNYQVGSGANLLYSSSGGSDDWAKAKASIKYVYLLELRPSEREWSGFILDKKQLVPTGRETWEGVKVVISAIVAEQQAAEIQKAGLAKSNSVSSGMRSTLGSTVKANIVSENARQRSNFTHGHSLKEQQRGMDLNKQMTCTDNSKWCHAWIKDNNIICRTSSILMRQSCRKSCNYCAQ